MTFLMKKFIHNEIFGNSDSGDPKPSPGRKFCRESESDHKTSQNHEKLRNLEKHEKHQKTSGFIDFWTFKINFRSADAANRVNRDPRYII